MRETITIQIGQCGNQIGNQFWSLLLKEHQDLPDASLALSSFFKFGDSRRSNGPTSKLSGSESIKARALLVDMECGPLTQTMKGPLGYLFDETQFVMDVYGSGNNFAHGHMVYGAQYRENFEEGIRRNAEQCDSLQTFLVTHSLGGGTGSGVGTYIVGLLQDLYPEVYRFSACVYPSVDDDVITSPYNCMLATRELIDHADCVFPIDNKALQEFAALEEAQRSKVVAKLQEGRSGLPVDAAAASKGDDRGFNEMNNVAARMLCHLTSSSRFHGDMNVDLNEIYTNLVPYPQLKFLMTALNVNRPTSGSESAAAAFVGLGGDGASAPRRASSTSTGTSTSGGMRSKSAGRPGPKSPSLSSNASSDASNSSNKILVQRAFQDILTRSGQITGAVPTSVPRDAGPVCMAVAFLARGAHVPFSEYLKCVTNAQRKQLRFPIWSQDACKIGVCGVPAPGEKLSVLGIYNSTAFGSVLRREKGRFDKLFRRHAMVHHYTEFMDISMFSEAENAVASVIESYEIVEQGKVPIWSVSPAWNSAGNTEKRSSRGSIPSTPTPTPSSASSIAKSPSAGQTTYPSRLQGAAARGMSSRVPPSFLQVTASRGSAVFSFDQFCQDKLFPSF